MSDELQVAGATMILGAYALAQFGRLGQTTYVYILLNLCGSLLLAGIALLGKQWGFFILEAAWAVITLFALQRRIGPSKRSEKTT